MKEKELIAAIRTMRYVLMMYGYSHLLENFNMWTEWFERGDFGMDCFTGGIQLEVSLALRDVSSDLRDALYMKNYRSADAHRKVLKRLSVLL